jgi:predicted TIM-barrel fold metal-dependent hydrolase
MFVQSTDSTARVRTALSRRDFLQTAGLTAAAVSLGSFPFDADAGTAGAEIPPIVDCHAHVYGSDESKYPTIANPYRPPAGKGTPAHLRKQLAAAGVGFATAIQTSTFYGWDNRCLADTARDNRDLLVGVCTLNPDDARSPDLLERYVRESNVRGMRSIPGSSGRYVDPGVEALWAAAERLGVVVNINTGREKRAEIETLARRHSGLKVVIDHCLYLSAGQNGVATLGDMRILARLPNVYAKLSCVVTGSAESYPFADMHEPCRQIIAAFGPERCVWGSDFPCELWCPKATYSQHLRVFTHEMGLDAESKRWVLGQTARRLYF